MSTATRTHEVAVAEAVERLDRFNRDELEAARTSVLGVVSVALKAAILARETGRDEDADEAVRAASRALSAWRIRLLDGPTEGARPPRKVGV